MPTKPVPPADIRKAAAEWNRDPSRTYAEAAKKIGMNRETFVRWLKLAQEQGIEVAEAENKYTVNHRASRGPQKVITPPSIPPPNLPADEIWSIREREFSQKKKHEEAVKLIPLEIPFDGPIGLLFFGDPHVDDDGTDLALLRHHAELTRKIEGLWGANVGDTTNNWVGRLARLWGEQGTSEAEAAIIARHFVDMVNWAFLLGGNHDVWHGGERDIMKWICAQKGALYRSTEARLELRFPNGAKCRVNARHDFEGHSMWNTAHGPAKASIMGVRDHINVCGHKHTSGHNVNKDPDKGIAMHAIRVASYKIYDRYKKEKGFRDQDLGPACVAIVNPLLPETHPDYVLPVWDPDYAVCVLEGLRKRKTYSLAA